MEPGADTQTRRFLLLLQSGSSRGNTAACFLQPGSARLAHRPTFVGPVCASNRRYATCDDCSAEPQVVFEAGGDFLLSATLSLPASSLSGSSCANGSSRLPFLPLSLSRPSWRVSLTVCLYHEDGNCVQGAGLYGALCFTGQKGAGRGRCPEDPDVEAGTKQKW